MEPWFAVRQQIVAHLILALILFKTSDSMDLHFRTLVIGRRPGFARTARQFDQSQPSPPLVATDSFIPLGLDIPLVDSRAIPIATPKEHRGLETESTLSVPQTTVATAPVTEQTLRLEPGNIIPPTGPDSLPTQDPVPEVGIADVKINEVNHALPSPFSYELPPFRPSIQREPTYPPPITYHPGPLFGKLDYKDYKPEYPAREIGYPPSLAELGFPGAPRSAYASVRELNLESQASTIFSSRSFDEPPSPYDLGFPGITNTEDNWKFDFDWDKIGRKKRSAPEARIRHTDNIAVETSSGSSSIRVRPDSDRRARGSSDSKTEYEGPYIYTQLFGPPYEVGYIRSPIPSKHVYEDYLQFVRSWSAASRDAVDSHLKAKPEDISQYKNPSYSGLNHREPSHAASYNEPSYSSPATKVSYDENSNNYKPTSYLPTNKESTYKEPSGPVYREPSYKEQSYTTPAYKEPAYKEPAYATSSYKEPVYKETGQATSLYKETAYNTGYSESGYKEPAYPTPAYKEPAYKDPTYTPQDYKEPAYKEPVYKEPPYTTPAYKEPVYKEPTYTTPAYKEPAYKEPAYTTPAYKEPVYKEPTYTTPAYKEPVYKEPPYTTPAYKEPVYKEPTYTTPSYKEPVYKEPTYTTPAYKEPAYKEPVHREPTYTTPAYKEPGYKEPTYTTPAYKEPVYKEPTYTTPAYKEPAYKEPTYTTPAYREPVYKEPTYTTPAYKEPAYKEPTYTTPAYKEPVYKEATYTTPAYKEPAYKEPAHREPTYTTPAYKEPAYKEPAYKEPAYKESTHQEYPNKEPASKGSSSYTVVVQSPSYIPPKTTVEYHSPKNNYVAPESEFRPMSPKYEAPAEYLPPKQTKEYVTVRPDRYETPKYQPSQQYEGAKIEIPKTYDIPPKYDAAPTYESSKYEETKYESPAYEPIKKPDGPKYDEPKYESPKYNDPKYENTKYEEVKHEIPKYEQELPKYDESKYEAPTTYTPPKSIQTAKDSYTTPYRDLFPGPPAYTTPSYKNGNSQYYNEPTTPGYKEIYASPSYSNPQTDIYSKDGNDVAISSTSYKTVSQTYEKPKDSYDVDSSSYSTASESYKEETKAYATESSSTKKHFPVIIGRYQVTDSRAFLPRPVNGKEPDIKSVEHLRGPNGQEYVVYYLPYGQPLPVPVRKRRMADKEAVSRIRRSPFEKKRKNPHRGNRKANYARELLTEQGLQMPCEHDRSLIEISESATNQPPSPTYASDIHNSKADDSQIQASITSLNEEKAEEITDVAHHIVPGEKLEKEGIKAIEFFDEGTISSLSVDTETIPSSLEESSRNDTSEEQFDNQEITAEDSKKADLTTSVILQDEEIAQISDVQHSLQFNEEEAVGELESVKIKEQAEFTEQKIQEIADEHSSLDSAGSEKNPSNFAEEFLNDSIDEMIKPNDNEEVLLTPIDAEESINESIDEIVTPNDGEEVLATSMDGEESIDTVVKPNDDEEILMDTNVETMNDDLPIEGSQFESVSSEKLEEDKENLVVKLNGGTTKDATASPMEENAVGASIQESDQTTELIANQPVEILGLSLEENSNSDLSPEIIPGNETVPNGSEETVGISQITLVSVDPSVDKNPHVVISMEDGTTPAPYRTTAQPTSNDTKKPYVLPGLTQRPIQYLKPPGLANENQSNWNGYSTWWTKVGSRVAEIYNYQ